jgi:hypothetical protein
MSPNRSHYPRLLSLLTLLVLDVGPLIAQPNNESKRDADRTFSNWCFQQRYPGPVDGLRIALQEPIESTAAKIIRETANAQGRVSTRPGSIEVSWPSAIPTGELICLHIPGPRDSPRVASAMWMHRGRIVEDVTARASRNLSDRAEAALSSLLAAPQFEVKLDLKTLSSKTLSVFSEPIVLDGPTALRIEVALNHNELARLRRLGSDPKITLSGSKFREAWGRGPYLVPTSVPTEVSSIAAFVATTPASICGERNLALRAETRLPWDPRGATSIHHIGLGLCNLRAEGGCLPPQVAGLCPLTVLTDCKGDRCGGTLGGNVIKGRCWPHITLLGVCTCYPKFW